MDDQKALAAIYVDQTVGTAIDDLLVLDPVEDYPREWWIYDWWPRVNFNTAKWAGLAKIGGLATGVILAIVEKHWDTLPVELTVPFQDKFSLWAAHWTDGLDKGTIDNQMRVARTFVLDWDKLPEEYRPPAVIYIPERTEEGNIILEQTHDGVAQRMIPVEWDPTKVDASKLLLARARVNSGTATPEIWEALMDPKVTWNETRRIVAGLPPTGKPENVPSKNGDIVVRLEQSEIIATHGYLEVTVIGGTGINFSDYFDVTSPKGELVRSVLDPMLDTWHLRLPDDGN